MNNIKKLNYTKINKQKVFSETLKFKKTKAAKLTIESYKSKFLNELVKSKLKQF